MSGHTPGPWHVIVGTGNKLFVEAYPNRGIIAECGFSNSKMETANARLIAAAPALLAACEDACATLNKQERTQKHGLADWQFRLRTGLWKAIAAAKEGKSK